MPPNVTCDDEVYVDVEFQKEKDVSRDCGCDFETAISYAGTGKFQKVLLAVSGVIYATCAISSTTLSFVLPSAECDFSLSSADKGKLSAVPLLGMLFGCSIWGSIANSKGRRTAIILALSMDFLAAFISSFVQSYVLFAICRFLNGFGIIGATSLVFSYLGEFLSVKDRDKYLGKLEIFWNIGVIVLPGVAWCFLNKKAVQIFDDGSDFSPWRIFVLVCSLPSLLSAISIYFLPETPKFLISKGQFKAAKTVFQKIYSCNTSRHAESFPIRMLEGEGNNNGMTNSKVSISDRNQFTESISKFCGSVRHLVYEQYFKYLTITCLADFGLMASYYTLVMWFPEIFDRFSQYHQRFPDDHSAISVCVVSQANFSSNIIDQSAMETCDPSIANNVFFDTLIIGLSCIPTSVSLSYLMYKVGKKSVLVFSLILSGISTLSLNWVSSVGQTLALSCIFEALTSILEAILFCVVVDLFPTSLRAIALTTTATCGRMGAIFGNLIFGALLDLNCVVPIYLFGIMLIVSGLLCIALPRNENYITLK
ncbi:synaptic vesicle glycoprotein 2C-like [Euwallacea fornicatus]|uniref:synaptic vesicle glycoprotein 2C-like n=1 Tax=Euwallacea fornicatus TaxID=995702 RepID=UPI00338F4269